MAVDDGVEVPLEPPEQTGVGDHAVLDHLVQPGAELAARQRVEQQRVDHNRDWLVESADEVLAERMVDSHLAADGRIHLRQQCRRHMHEADAAKPGGGGKARDISDDTAADGDDGDGSVGGRLRQRIVDEPDRPDRLRPLPVRHEAVSGEGEGGADPLAVRPPDGWTRDDEPRAVAAGLGDPAVQMFHRTRTDANPVGA